MRYLQVPARVVPRGSPGWSGRRLFLVRIVCGPDLTARLEESQMKRLRRTGRAAVKRVLDPQDYMWKLIAFGEIAGFAYLFWAISYAAHINLAGL